MKNKIVTIPTGNITNSDLNDVPAINQPMPVSDSNYSKSEDVISALVNLGYQRLEAYRAVSKVMAENADANVPTLIRLALKEFANKDY